jgi:hypothetical protein
MIEWLASLPEGLVIFEGDGPWWDRGSVLESTPPPPFTAPSSPRQMWAQV